tara:strand:- start:258 stop:503 length:246 start_codon:yes stop_codon:yes gene_type:complete
MTLHLIDDQQAITAEEAIAYVNAQSTSGEQWFAFRAQPHCDDHALFWTVKAELNGRDIVEWWVAAESGPDARGDGRIYGEW